MTTARHLFLLFAAVALVLSGYGLYHYLHPTQSDDGALRAIHDAQKKQLAPVADEYYWGDAGAPISVVVYDNTDCSYCERYHKILTQLKAQRKDFTLLFRHHELPEYPQAIGEAVILSCVARIAPELFTTAHTALYTQKDVDPSEIVNNILDTPVRAAELNECRNDILIKTAIQERDLLGIGLGVTKTPHTFIFTKDSPIYSLSGVQSMHTLTSLLDALARR